MKYAIKKETRGDGVIEYTPLAKESGLFSLWKQIILVNNKFWELKLSDDPSGLNLIECNTYIEGYKAHLEELESKRIVKTEIEDYVPTNYTDTLT